MKNLKFVLIALATLSSLILCQEGVNHCKARQCGKCRLKDGTKYCSNCYRSFMINSFQHQGTEGTVNYSGTLGECSTVGYPEESKKCRSAYQADNANSSGCASCEWGYVLSEGTVVNGKTDYACAEPPTKIENCLTYYRDWQTKVVKCGRCAPNFYSSAPEYLACVAVPEASKLTNCRYTNQNSQNLLFSCGDCEEGYLAKYDQATQVSTCQATVFKGCNQENETKTQCVDCNTSLGWWATDVSNEKGQICEHKSSILSILGTLALFLGLSLSL